MQLAGLTRANRLLHEAHNGAVALCSFRCPPRSLLLAARTASTPPSPALRLCEHATLLRHQLPAGARFSRPLRAIELRLTRGCSSQGKVLLVLYDGGEHARQEPALLGAVENELGIRKWLEDQGHTLVTTSDKEGESSKFDKELVDAEVIITTP